MSLKNIQKLANYTLKKYVNEQELGIYKKKGSEKGKLKNYFKKKMKLDLEGKTQRLKLPPSTLMVKNNEEKKLAHLKTSRSYKNIIARVSSKIILNL